MRLNPRIIFDSRKRLDEQLRPWEPFRKFNYHPPKGWIKAIREALGMSSRQLAKNMKKMNSEILAMERREAEGKITLHTLKQAAQALGCRLVYALVPDHSLESMVHNRAMDAAQRIVSQTSQSMLLENQKVTDQKTEAQRKDLAFELERKLDPRIWSDNE